jgi:hypothetical protein
MAMSVKQGRIHGLEARLARAFGAALVACLLFLQNAAAQQKPAATLADLRWIAGVWTLSGGDHTVEEQWTEPASNAMLGLSRTLAGGRMVAFEFLRIETRPEGIFYVAQPGGRPPTDFRLTSWDGRTATFENPAHDFPRRILYTHNADGSLTARVDGGAGVTQGAQSFAFKRTR